MSNQLVFISRDEIAQALPQIVFHPDAYIGHDVRTTTTLVGPPGTGKTSMVFDLARDAALVGRYNALTGLERASIPVYVTACHPDATAPEVFGNYLPLDGTWTFVPGAMLRAWGYKWHAEHVADKAEGHDGDCDTPPPGIHLLDDIHLMGPGGQSAMYKACDSGQGGSHLDPWGALVYPHPATLTLCTMNGEIDSLDPAVQDRTAARVPVMEPSTPMLEALAPDIKQLCQADYDNNMDPIATYREWLSISQLRPVLGIGRAVLLALGKVERAKRMIESLAEVEPILINAGIMAQTTEARDALQTLIRTTPAAKV